MQDTNEILKAVLDPGRRTFFRQVGKLGLGATGGLLLSGLPKLQAQTSGAQDTANQIFTAALVAEDLASTFYYNGLVGGVIQDPALAGPGGTAVAPAPGGDAGNVSYIRAALGQEIQHADLLRTVANLGADATTDPYQTFYFPAGTFDTLAAFIGTLEALENAFIGAYLVATREFAALALGTASSVPDGPFGGPYSAAQLNWFAQVAASIMGIECEHRVLGRDIAGINQANNLNYESTDGLLSVYNGPNSAVAALTPFLTSSTGPGYSLATALSQAPMIALPSTGNAPAYVPASLTASPNPIPVASGADLGMTTISWNAPSASVIQVRVGAPDGDLFTDNVNLGSMATGLWVSDGLTFYLQDVSSGQAPTAANTLATLVVNLKSA
jgi:Ferritin-like domain